ncbi:hypothetical protein [Campylobacter canadensis]|uniref:hypothetical protein n=1 Tax=Campylobacter canadensis TaxID=449520 RepID=UPI001CCAA2E5|nr:hypothetical protein [Campylobacter canadensis]MBZ8002646.1 hypothetical protein [Campylobacter canadensis]
MNFIDVSYSYNNGLIQKPLKVQVDNFTKSELEKLNKYKTFVDFCINKDFHRSTLYENLFVSECEGKSYIYCTLNYCGNVLQLNFFKATCIEYHENDYNKYTYEMLFYYEFIYSPEEKIQITENEYFSYCVFEILKHFGSPDVFLKKAQLIAV